ncbi:hypothetical protein D3C84_730090 [compost metagenome]
MYPVKVLGNCTSLVRLNGADEVPGQGQVGQFALFVQGFLQVVLTDIADPGGEGFAHGSGGFGLAHGQQLDGRRLAPGGQRGGTDTCGERGKVVCYGGH